MAGFAFWQDLAHGLRDLLFAAPVACAVCGRGAVDPRISFCRTCLGRFSFLSPPICLQCGRMLRLATSGAGCPLCAGEHFFFSRASAPCLYEGALRAYLHEVKFQRNRQLLLALAGLLAQHVREDAAAYRGLGLVVPVPLHLENLERRGYNQASLLGEAVAAVLRRPLRSSALQRIRQTETQSRLDRADRKSNVNEAFRATAPAEIRGERVLLVDDILTTGYTASECARALLRAGAQEVCVLTLANGVIEDQWRAGSK